MFGFSKPTHWVGLSKVEQSALWQNGLVEITLNKAEKKIVKENHKLYENLKIRTLKKKNYHFISLHFI